MQLINIRKSFLAFRKRFLVVIREGFPKKTAVLLDFVQMRGGGGGGPCPNFFAPFIIALLVNKRSLFPPKCQYFEFKTVF